MTKEELFKKYSINDTHAFWDDGIDNWMSVEIYRYMHDGKLPQDDMSIDWVTKFLDKTEDIICMVELMKREDFGSLYLTAKRMIFRYSEHILETL